MAGTPVLGSALAGVSIGGSLDAMTLIMVSFEVVAPLTDPMGLLVPFTATVRNPSGLPREVMFICRPLTLDTSTVAAATETPVWAITDDAVAGSRSAAKHAA